MRFATLFAGIGIWIRTSGHSHVSYSQFDRAEKEMDPEAYQRGLGLATYEAVWH